MGYAPQTHNMYATLDNDNDATTATGGTTTTLSVAAMMTGSTLTGTHTTAPRIDCKCNLPTQRQPNGNNVANQPDRSHVYSTTASSTFLPNNARASYKTDCNSGHPTILVHGDRFPYKKDSRRGARRKEQAQRT